ncbi:hypothetical protein ACA910_016385 [Epithemia clementina (nom. ined.)]
MTAFAVTFAAVHCFVPFYYGTRSGLLPPPPPPPPQQRSPLTQLNGLLRRRKRRNNEDLNSKQSQDSVAVLESTSPARNGKTSTVSKSTNHGLKTFDNNGDERVVTPNNYYSLGLQAYHPTQQKKQKKRHKKLQSGEKHQPPLRPVVKFFSDDLTKRPYSLHVKSNNQIVAQQQTHAPAYINNNNNNNNNATKKNGINLTVSENDEEDDSRGNLEQREVRFSVPDQEVDENGDFGPLPSWVPSVLLDNKNFLWQLPNASHILNFNHNDTNNNINNDINNAAILTLPLPFAPQSNRTTPISLAENLLLQLAPTLVNVSASIPLVVWNTSTIVSSMARPPDLTVVWNSTSSNAANAAQQALQNLSATASFAESLAESLIHFMEEAVQQPGNDIMNNLTARLGGGGGGGGGFNNLQQQAALLSAQRQNDGSFKLTTFMDPSQQQQQQQNASSHWMPKVRPVTFNTLKPSFSSVTPSRWRGSFQNANNNNRTLSKAAAAALPPSPLPLITPDKNLTDSLTLEDLEFVLQANGYVKQSDLSMLTSQVIQEQQQQQQSRMQSFGLEGVGEPVSAQQHALKASNKKSVAFPQPSVLSYESLKWGTTISSAFLLMVVSVAIAPNLWLVGMLGGGFYGYDLAKQLPVAMPKALLPRVLVRVGTRAARTSLQMYDFVIALIFMWKTGVLSYEYWKQYAVLDKRFGIQDKMDAWNARFIEGKESFDKWEKENEVGRKVLATLRTVWLVEERSLKKGMKKRRKQSRYRLVQLLYDAAYNLGKFAASVLKLLTGGDSTELTEFLRGLRVEISQTRVAGIGTRVGAVLAALLVVNLMGALFTVSPFLLAIVATLGSLVWPTWVAEMFDRWNTFLQETRALGRIESDNENVALANKRPMASVVGAGAAGRGSRRRIDKSQFHFYVRPDGTKQYYRTGKPFWPWLRKKEPKKKDLFGFLGLK